MFRRSDLYHKLRTGQIQLAEDMHLIGDSAYVIAPYMMIPFDAVARNNERKIRFNVALSSSRSAIERAFALLKGRFRRLKYLEMTKIEMIPMFIMACCILHNVCILEEDFDWVEQDPDIDEMPGGDDINEELMQAHENEGQLKRAGNVKRQQLANTIYNRGRRLVLPR
jgi:hypothetical protein